MMGNAVGRVAEAGAPKWRACVYDCADYRGYMMAVSLEPDGTWFGWAELSDDLKHSCVRHTPDDAMKAVQEWVDAQVKS